MRTTGTTRVPPVPPVRRPALPRPYLRWLAGTRASLAGDAALTFALGWAASAHGGRTAALVLTAITVPRTVFLLVGGALGDRVGARRVMIVGDAVLLVAALGLAVLAAAAAPTVPVWTLIAFAAVTGTVDAFHLPATGSMPRRLVGREQLPRAMALQQAGGQVAALLGAPLGAALVAVAGLGGAALVDAGTFAAVLAVMVRVRPAAEEEPSTRREGLVAGIADGVRLVATDPVLRPALLLTAAAAAGLLPVVGLLGPLLARSAGWGPGVAGLVAAGQSAGVLAVALVAARRGPLRRTGAGASLGLAVAGAGTGLLAAAPAPVAAVLAAAVVGAGSSLFACHIGPLVLGASPASHLSRVQSALTLVQSAALVPATNALGGLARAAGPRSALALCAALGCAAAVAGLASPALRRAGGSTAARANAGRRAPG